MTDYASKPIRQAELEAAFDRIGIDPAPALPVAEFTLADAVIDLGTFQTIRELKDSQGRSALQRIVSLYLDAESRQLDRFDHLAQERRVEELAQEAHSFGGSAVSFGGLQVRRIALEVESAARASDWAGVTKLLAALREACGRLRVELSRLDWDKS
jgi:HPt (histidine-containing phosphotransfer) domain-containing protein